ncbi:MAG: hypothetical protein HYW02_00240 [Deltaproteobacteria bacterium]|nr:hypothetical protein [Deltaproteobacteria bacterium]
MIDRCSVGASVFRSIDSALQIKTGNFFCESDDPHSVKGGGYFMSLPEVRSAVDRIISDVNDNDGWLKEASVSPLLNRVDPPAPRFFRNKFPSVTRLFFSGSIGDFLDRNEYQEVLRLLYLVEEGQLGAEPAAVARLKAFKDRGPDSRTESVAVWTVLAPVFSGASATATGGLIAFIAKNIKHRVPAMMEPAKKYWFSALTVIGGLGAVYGALDD